MRGLGEEILWRRGWGRNKDIGKTLRRCRAPDFKFRGSSHCQGYKKANRTACIRLRKRYSKADATQKQNALPRLWNSEHLSIGKIFVVAMILEGVPYHIMSCYEMSSTLHK